jgi:hypothetical protein
LAVCLVVVRMFCVLDYYMCDTAEQDGFLPQTVRKHTMQAISNGFSCGISLLRDSVSPLDVDSTRQVLAMLAELAAAHAIVNLGVEVNQNFTGFAENDELSAFLMTVPELISNPMVTLCYRFRRLLRSNMLLAAEQCATQFPLTLRLPAHFAMMRLRQHQVVSLLSQWQPPLKRSQVLSGAPEEGEVNRSYVSRSVRDCCDSLHMLWYPAAFTDRKAAR